MSCDNTKKPSKEVRHNELYINKRGINSKLHKFFLLKQEEKNGKYKKGDCCVWWDSGNKIWNNLGFSGMSC
jgi:hypothetical protein